MKILDHKTRYLQIAFNYDLTQAMQIIPRIPKSKRIFIEAGTPFIKKEGMRGVSVISRMWGGHVVADLKVTDGAIAEVDMVRRAGATAATVFGNSPPETLELFIKRCKELNMISMVDMLGNDNPVRVLQSIKVVPDVVVLHKGRDEEQTRGKIIKYKHINKIHSKYSVSIAAAGGIDLKEARSAIFNGSNIVVANIVTENDPWTGIDSADDVGDIAREFLTTIE